MKALLSIRGSVTKRTLLRSSAGAALLGALAILFASAGHAQTPPGRYTIAAGVVTDTKTGLEWQQAESGATYLFAAAQQHCASLGGAWRVPSVKELLTLVDDSRSYPAIDASVFSSVPSTGNIDTCYQSSTPRAGSSLTWIVCFDEGRPTYAGTSEAYRALCVR